MSTAKDPFEEFLRKKKVEMLEKQFREDGPDAEAEEEPVEDGWSQHAAEDSHRDQQVEQEMNEFFEQGGRGGAELFQRAKSKGIDEEKVEEIKDALDDVFEAPTPVPHDATADNETFVDFFKQVQTDFEAEARETVQPDEGAPFQDEDEPLTADFPLPGEEDVAPALELDHAPAAFPEVDQAVEGLADPVVDEAAVDASVGLESPAPLAEDLPELLEESDSDRGLSLADILTPPQEGEDLRQRVDLLSRLIVKLVERSKVPESELIEVLIKSGVEF